MDDEVTEGITLSVNDIEVSRWLNEDTAALIKENEREEVEAKYVSASLDDPENLTLELQQPKGLSEFKILLSGMLGVTMVVLVVVVGLWVYTAITDPNLDDEDFKEIASITYLSDDAVEVEIPIMFENTE